MAEEHLANGVGVGVVISSRDLAYELAAKYAESYHALGAHVMIDRQFYTPDSVVGKLDTYPDADYRNSISQLHQMDDAALSEFSTQLLEISTALSVDAVIAPAVIYEHGRPEIHRLNRRLFQAARAVGNKLAKPVYATVVIGRSAAATDPTINSALSEATSLDADGWYYAFEFEEERIPSSRQAVRRCCAAGLTLACTGKPVMHAYAGPMGLLSFGFGATSVGIGHSQNLWKFDRSRWDEPAGGGGGGDAPARHFSASLWGTIIDPDEVADLTAPLRQAVLTDSPYRVPWTRWQANKHLVHVIGSTIGDLAATTNPRTNANAAIASLAAAVELHSEIIAASVQLRDGTDSYQANWSAALADVLVQHTNDYDFLELLA